jgi:hypothetical protein
VRRQRPVEIVAAPKIAEEKCNITIGPGAGRHRRVFSARTCLPNAPRAVDIDPKQMLSEVELVKDRFLGNLGPAMFVLLPSFALC